MKNIAFGSVNFGRGTRTGLATIFAAVIVGCGGNRQRATEGRIPVFDIAEALMSERAFNLEDISDEISYTPLDDSIVVGNISAMRESRDRLYVSDGYRNPVKVFDRSGRFVFTQGVIGRGPTELNRISALAVDYETSNLYLTGGESVVAFDDEGRQFARRDSISNGQNIVFEDGELIVHKYLSGSTAVGDPVPIIETFSSTLGRTGGVDVRFKGSTDELYIDGAVTYPPSGVMFDNGDDVFVKETLSDTVFVYSSGRGLTPAFRLDMGRNTIPAGAYGSDAATVWDREVYFLAGVFDGRRHLFMRMIKYYEGEFTHPYVVYDKEDVSGGFTTDELFVDGMPFIPCYIRDNRLVGYVNALAAAGKIEGVEEDDNPVIVIAKLKK